MVLAIPITEASMQALAVRLGTMVTTDHSVIPSGKLAGVGDHAPMEVVVVEENIMVDTHDQTQVLRVQALTSCGDSQSNLAFQ